MTMPSLFDANHWEIANIASPVDRESIRFGLWSRTPSFRRALVFLNGRSEWIEKYAFLPQLLALPEDCAFVTMDHRGQGGSGGIRAHVDRFQDYVEDVKAVIAETLGEAPYAMLAHSMGGLIAMAGTLAGDFAPTNLVLSAPLLRLPNHPVPRQLSQPLSRLAQWTKMGRRATGAGNERTSFANNPLTQSPEAFRLIQNSPYKIGSPTFAWVSEIFRATHTVFADKSLEQRRTPTLVLGGSDERVIDGTAFSQWVQKAAKLSSVPARYLMIQGARHELLNEISNLQDKAIQETRQWLHNDIYALS